MARKLQSDSSQLFGARVWDGDEIDTRIGLWFELGRHMPEALKQRWLEGRKEGPQVPGASTELVPGPGVVLICQYLGPESLDLWVFLAEFRGPGEEAALAEKLKEYGIAWMAEGNDICVRRRDRVFAMRAVGLGPWGDAYVMLCGISVRENDPAPLVQLLSSLLEAEDSKGFIDVSPQKVGYGLVPFVRYARLGTDPKARASHLNKRIVSALQEVTTRFAVGPMYPQVWIPEAGSTEREKE